MALRIPLLPHPVRWLLTIGVVGLIAYWSLVKTPPSVPALEAPLLTAEAVTTSGLAPLADSEIPSSHRKHATAYAILTLSLAYAIADREASLASKALIVFTLVMGIGIAMEAGQLFRPGRTASLADVAVNGVGAAIALNWYTLESRARFVPVVDITQGRTSTRE